MPAPRDRGAALVGLIGGTYNRYRSYRSIALAGFRKDPAVVGNDSAAAVYQNSTIL